MTAQRKQVRPRFTWKPAEQMNVNPIKTATIAAQVAEVILLASPNGVFEVYEAGQLRVTGRHGDCIETAKEAAESHGRSILNRRGVRK